MLPTSEHFRPPGLRHAGPIAAIVLFAVTTISSSQPSSASGLGERVTRLTRDSAWKSVTSIPVAFPTHHPQGMVKVGDTLFVSSVEVRVPTVRFDKPVDGYDRDTGQGVGHLFKMTMTGALISDLTLGEGSMYHPGGIDYDGRHIWVSVAEYRPNSRSIVYRIDPENMKAVEMFRYPDHLGAIVHDTDDRTLHGVSWGSRRFYRWTLDRNGRVTNATVPPETLRRLNPSHYVDYQDCKYVGGRRMLCSGVTEIRASRAAARTISNLLQRWDCREHCPKTSGRQDAGRPFSCGRSAPHPTYTSCTYRAFRRPPDQRSSMVSPSRKRRQSRSCPRA